MAQKKKSTSRRPRPPTQLVPISASEFSKALEGIKLTLKQRRWLQLLFGKAKGNATEAARQVYNCRSEPSAWMIGYENLRKLALPISIIMDLVGLNDVRIAQALYEGLEADKVAVATFEGEVTDWEAFPDYATRKQYAELILRTKGHLRDRLEIEHVIHDPGDYKPGETDPEAYIEACLNGSIIKEAGK